MNQQIGIRALGAENGTESFLCNDVPVTLLHVQLRLPVEPPV